MSNNSRLIGVKVIRRLTADYACVWTANSNFSSFTPNQLQTEEDDRAGKQSSQGSSGSPSADRPTATLGTHCMSAGHAGAAGETAGRRPGRRE